MLICECVLFWKPAEIIWGGYYMREFDVLYNEARFIFGHLRTNWNNYDFAEKSEVLEKRVPKIEFLVPVDVMCEDLFCYEIRDDFKQYVRECQVCYNGNTYIFEISAFTQYGAVLKYQIEAFVPAGDGKGGKKTLFVGRI